MNNASENDIDRILSALRDTQPSEGMESRILQGIQHRTPVRSTWFRWTPPMQWGVAALATAAIVLAVALTAYNPHEKTTQPTIATTDLTPNSVISTGAQRSGVVISTGAQRSGEIAAFTEASATHTPAHLKSASSPTQPAYPPHTLLCDCDRLAMDEMEAPSHPAPAMPLTAQERLLQRVVRQNDSFELAELEPLKDHPFRAAPAKEDDAFKGAVQSFLKQLAAAETLNPTAPTVTPEAVSVPDSNDPALPAESANSPN